MKPLEQTLVPCKAVALDTWSQILKVRTEFDECRYAYIDERNEEHTKEELVDVIVAARTALWRLGVESQSEFAELVEKVYEKNKKRNYYEEE